MFLIRSVPNKVTKSASKLSVNSTDDDDRLIGRAFLQWAKKAVVVVVD